MLPITSTQVEEGDMAHRTIEVRKVTPHCGAEVHGVDLSTQVDEGVAKQLQDALAEHCVLFFRNQQMTPDQQKAFGRRFGDLHIHPAYPMLLDGHPEIMVIYADERSKRVAGEDWHSDVSCDAEPPLGTVLYMVDVPPVGGDTLFASMYAAYDTLSAPMKRLLEGMTAIHDGERLYRGRYEGVVDEGKVYPKSEHPVIRTHPVSGRKALFVNRGFTTRITQLEKHESDAVLEMLYRHIETPEFQCRFQWQPGSVAFWDNRCAQHHAMWDYYPHRRRGLRVTIKGDRPFYRA
jgi:taurine dioxygenase